MGTILSRLLYLQWHLWSLAEHVEDMYLARFHSRSIQLVPVAVKHKWLEAVFKERDLLFMDCWAMLRAGVTAQEQLNLMLLLFLLFSWGWVEAWVTSPKGGCTLHLVLAKFKHRQIFNHKLHQLGTRIYHRHQDTQPRHYRNLASINCLHISNTIKFQPTQWISQTSCTLTSLDKGAL